MDPVKSKDPGDDPSKKEPIRTGMLGDRMYSDSSSKSKTPTEATTAAPGNNKDDICNTWRSKCDERKNICTDPKKMCTAGITGEQCKEWRANCNDMRDVCLTEPGQSTGAKEKDEDEKSKSSKSSKKSKSSKSSKKKDKKDEKEKGKSKKKKKGKK